MTDAVFSFGTDGLEAIAQVEKALTSLMRTSEEVKVALSTDSGFNLGVPQSAEGITTLISELDRLKTAIAEVRGESTSATDILALDKTSAAIQGTIELLDAQAAAQEKVNEVTQQGKLSAADQAALKESIVGRTQALIEEAAALDASNRGYTESEVAQLRAAEAARQNAADVREETAAITERSAALREDIQTRAADAAAAARQESQSSFAGGFSRGALRHGSTVTSNLGYDLARQGEFVLTAAAQFAAFGAAAQGVDQIKEYQKGVADLKIAMGDASGANQTYLNQLADLSRTVGENAAEAFDSAASGVRAFQVSLQELQGRPATTAEKQQIGLAVTQNATQLGVIGGEGQNTATDQIIAIGTAYGLQAAELNQVTDAIAATKRFVGGEPSQIAGGLARFAKSASDGGLDLNGAAALIGLVQSRTGESGDAIASSLGRILQTVGGTHGDKIAAQYANDSVVSAADRATLANGNASEWQRLQAFSDIFRGGDTATRDNILSAIGGTRNRAEASSLLGEMPVLSQFDKQFNGSGANSASGQGVAQFNQQMATLEGTIKRIEGDLRNIAADLGNSGLFELFGALAHAADPILSTLDDVLRALGQINSIIPHSVGVLGGVGEIYLGSKAINAYRGRSGASGDPAAVALEEAATQLKGAAAALDGSAGAIKEGAAAEGLGGIGGVAAEEEASVGILGRLRGLGGPFAGLGLTALGGAIANGQQGSWQNNVGTALSDAGVGATIGSFIPGLGTVGGGLIGLGVGGLKDWIDSAQKDNQNEQYLQATQTAAQQQIAVGNFAQAVKDFETAAAALRAGGDGRRADVATSLGRQYAGVSANPEAARIAELSAPVRPAGTSAIDKAAAGRIDLQHEAELRRLSRGSSWSVKDLADAILGQNYNATLDRNLNNYKFNGKLPSTGSQAYDDAVHDTRAEISAQPGNLESIFRSAVQKAVKDQGISQDKSLTDSQITSIVKDALPGLTQNQINGLIPQIKGTLDSLAKGDGAAGAISGLSNLEANAAPDIIASYDQIRKAMLKSATTKAQMESINLKYGTLEVNAADNNSQLIAAVFHNLDQSTINKIVAAGNDAATAANAAATMSSDVQKALATVANAEAADLAQAVNQGLGVTALFGVTDRTNSPDVRAAQALIDRAKAAASAATQRASAINQAANIGGAPASLPRGGGSSGAGHQYDYVKSAIAEARAARAGGGDVAAAMAAIADAQDQLDHNARNTAAWWRAYAALWQAKEQLAKAEATQAQTNYLLTHDATNPVVQAEAAVVAARKQLALDKSLGFNNEVINKDKLALLQAEDSQQKAVFDQEMTNMQTREQLGQISQAAYIRWLHSEETSLEAIKNKTQQQKDELNQVALALQQANDSMNASFNLTSIDARGLIYQVRALSQIAPQAGSIPGAGIVNNNSHNTTINITAVQTAEQIAALVAKAVAAAQKTPPKVTTRPRRA